MVNPEGLLSVLAAQQPNQRQTSPINPLIHGAFGVSRPPKALPHSVSFVGTPKVLVERLSLDASIDSVYCRLSIDTEPIG